MYVYAVLFLVVALLMTAHTLSVNRASLSASQRGSLVRLATGAAVGLSVSVIFFLAFEETGAIAALACANAASATAPILLWLALHRAGSEEASPSRRYVMVLPVSVTAVAFCALFITALAPRHISSGSMNLLFGVNCGIVAIKAFSPSVRRLRGSTLVGAVVSLGAVFFTYRASFVFSLNEVPEGVISAVPLAVSATIVFAMCALGVSRMSRDLSRREEVKFEFLKQRAPLSKTLREGDMFNAYRVTIEDLPLVCIAFGEEICEKLQKNLAAVLLEIAPSNAELHEVGNDGFVLIEHASRADFAGEVRKACEADTRKPDGLSLYVLRIEKISGPDPVALLASLRRTFPAREHPRALQFKAVIQ